MKSLAFLAPKDVKATKTIGKASVDARTTTYEPFAQYQAGVASVSTLPYVYISFSLPFVTLEFPPRTIPIWKETPRLVSN